MHKALSKSGSGSRRAIDSDGCDSPRCRDSVRSITEADHHPAPGIPRNVSAACLFAVLNVCDCCKKEATGPRHGVSRQKILDTERVAINTGRLENFGYAASRKILARTCRATTTSPLDRDLKPAHSGIIYTLYHAAGRAEGACWRAKIGLTDVIGGGRRPGEDTMPHLSHAQQFAKVQPFDQ